jgi:hypothetical protein
MSDPIPQRHEMILQEAVSPDADEWFCPACGRRFLLRWPPNYEKVVLEQGDDRAVHVGGKGGVSIGVVDVAPALGEDAWRGWLREHGIDWDGPAA